MPIGKTVVFLLGTRLPSYWEYDCLPIGNTIVFPLEIGLDFHWR